MKAAIDPVPSQSKGDPGERLAPDRKMWRLSREELERRWALVRRRLEEEQLDALIVQGYEEKIGGYVRWLTDVPPGYPRVIVFHRDDFMTVIDHGPQGERRELGGDDADRPGVGEVITNWALVGGHYTSGLSAANVIDVVKGRGYRAVGLAGERSMPHGFVTDLKDGLGAMVRFSDETEFLDAAKARKSAEEIRLIERTAAMQDEVFSKLLEWIKPGLRDFEINAFIDYQMQLLGSERGVYIGASAPLGQPAGFAYRCLQGGTMQAGHHINVLLESNGLGGEWTEMGRLISFGKLPNRTREAHAVCLEAQANTARLCVPGANPADIFSAHNAFMVKHGSALEKRVHSHGQGYDAVERPLVRSDESMPLAGGMNLSIHPSYSSSAAFATICDNFLVNTDGSARRLHGTPSEMFEL